MLEVSLVYIVNSRLPELHSETLSWGWGEGESSLCEITFLYFLKKYNSERLGLGI